MHQYEITLRLRNTSLDYRGWLISAKLSSEVSSSPALARAYLPCQQLLEFRGGEEVENEDGVRLS